MTNPMNTDDQTHAAENDETREARSQMAHLKALFDASTYSKVREELREDMSSIAMSWYLDELFAEDTESHNQAVPPRTTDHSHSP